MDISSDTTLGEIRQAVIGEEPHIEAAYKQAVATHVPVICFFCLNRLLGASSQCRLFVDQKGIVADLTGMLSSRYPNPDTTVGQTCLQFTLE